MSTIKSTRWRFLTNHARVLVFIDKHEKVTVRVISDSLGIAEPSVRRIISQLMDAGYVSKRLVGRVNLYRVTATLPLKAPEFSKVPVRKLIDSLSIAEEGEALSKT